MYIIFFYNRISATIIQGNESNSIVSFSLEFMLLVFTKNSDACRHDVRYTSWMRLKDEDPIGRTRCRNCIDRGLEQLLVAIAIHIGEVDICRKTYLDIALHFRLNKRGQLEV